MISIFSFRSSGVRSRKDLWKCREVLGSEELNAKTPLISQRHYLDRKRYGAEGGRTGGVGKTSASSITGLGVGSVSELLLLARMFGGGRKSNREYNFQSP